MTDEVICPWNFNEPCTALVASDGAGRGCVLAHTGGGIDFLMSEAGLVDIGDLFSDVPEGLSFWEGRFRSSGPNHLGEYDEWIEGAFRPATIADIAKAFPEMLPF